MPRNPITSTLNVFTNPKAAENLRPKRVVPDYEAGLRLDELFDFDVEMAKLDAIAKSHGGNGEALNARAEVVVALKQLTQTARQRAETMLLEEDRRGILCAQRLSAVQDSLIRLIYNFALKNVFRVQNLSEGERIAIVAVGGYGRAMLAPHSDVDLLFVLPYKQTALGEQIVEYILYMLWDLGFTVGHATRSVDETMRQATADMTIRTSLVEARLVHGNASLFEELETRFHTEIAEPTSSEFIEAKLSERDARHRRMGESRYLVEPNVKEGKGALRDLHTLFWIGKYVYHVKRGRELVSRGVYTRAEHDRFLRAMEFFWTVRCHLHFLAKRPEERLSFDMQPALALRLGYEDKGALRGVERFMKSYFEWTRDVGNLTRIFCSALEEAEKKQAVGLFSRMTSSGPKAIGTDGVFIVENGRVNVTSPHVFEEPLNALRLFQIVDSEKLDYHPHALRALSRHLRYFDANALKREDMNALFLSILAHGRDPENTLRYMNEAGVLGRFIPDFGKIVAMMQFNMYHSYTVDEHLVRTVGVLAAIEEGTIAEEHPLASRLIPDIQERDLLYVALLIHDIAKGRPEDHSIAGAKVARKLGPRLGFSASQSELLAWLIEEHLTMSTFAQSRDLSDLRTIADFGAIVQTRERLRLLLVLTVCDIRAVGPNVWNGWKGQLLRTLYAETELYLTGGFSADERKGRAENARQMAIAHLTGDADDPWPQDKAEQYVGLHYSPFLKACDTPEVARITRLLAKGDEDRKPFLFTVDCREFKDTTQLKFMAADHPRLLSTIAQGCAAAGVTIVDARIFTTRDGRAISSIFVPRELPDNEAECRRASHIAKLIEDALAAGGSSLPAMIEKRGKRSRRQKAFQIEPRVTVSNELSDSFTVIEMECLDRLGLLADVAGELSNLNLNIATARVSTFGEKVIDTFYVNDLIGHRIESPQRRQRIRDAVLAAIERRARKEKNAGDGLVMEMTI
ncbi:MAG: [protein-PII] uridylyltransferase [Pseudomonadota bacterium]